MTHHLSAEHISIPFETPVHKKKSQAVWQFANNQDGARHDKQPPRRITHACSFNAALLFLPPNEFSADKSSLIYSLQCEVWEQW